MLRLHELLVLFLALLSAQTVLGEPPLESKPNSKEGNPVRTDLRGDPLPAGAVARIGTTRWLHPGAATVSFSPDGKTLIVGGSFSDREEPENIRDVESGKGIRRCITLRDVGTGKEIIHFNKDSGITSSVAVSPDGKAIASAHGDKRVRLWEAATGKIIRALKTQSEAYNVAFSPDGNVLAANTSVSGIQLWDVATGAETQRIAGGGRFLIFSPDGKILASHAGDRTVGLRDVSTGKIMRRFTVGEWCAAFSKDGKVLAIAGESEGVYVFGVSDGKELYQLPSHRTKRLWPLEEHGRALAFSPDGKLLVEGAGRTIQLLETATKKVAYRMERQGRVGAVAISPDGKTLAWLGSGPNIGLWKVGTKNEVQCQVVSIAFSPDGKSLATVCQEDTRVRLWETSTGKKVGELSAEEDTIRTVKVSPDGKYLAGEVVVEDQWEFSIRLWDLKSGKRLCQFDKEQGEWAFSPDGKSLVISNQEHIRVWDIGTAKKTEHKGGLGVAFTPEGKMLAVRSLESGSVHLLDLLTGKKLHDLSNLNLREESWPNGHFVFASGRTLVRVHNEMTLDLKSCKRSTVKCWDSVTGKVIAQEINQPDQVLAVAVSPDGKMLATSGRGKLVRIWETATGKERGRFRGHQDSVLTLAFSPDGKFLASGSADTTVLVWNVLGKVASE